MGVPGFFAWILKNFKNKILKSNLQIPPKYLYIDANCLFHPECFKILEYFMDETNPDKLENNMFERIVNYLDYIESFVNPSEMMYISVDGTAPLAKIGQQRKRRYKSVDDIRIKNEIKIKYNKKYNNCWNNTVITPGTEFMEKLHIYLLNHYKNKNKNNKNNKSIKSIKYIYSSYHTVGEGEHKILQHIKHNTLFDDNIVIYGLDADLIFLSLASNRNNIYLLRESDQFGMKKKQNDLFDPIKDVAQDLIFVSIIETKYAYNEQLWHIINSRSDIVIKLSRTTDFSNDLIFICFLLGNDFLPHFLSIDIHNNGLDTIINCYIECLEYIDYKAKKVQLLISRKNNNIIINNELFVLLLEKLAHQEDKYFREDLPRHIYYISKKKCFTSSDYERELWELENLKNIHIKDPIKLGWGESADWKFRYYEYHFHTIEHQQEFIEKLVDMYLQGIVWVTKYYFEECTDWQWQYPYDTSPFISDIVKFLKNKNINEYTFKHNKPIKIMNQLISVLPPSYSCTILLPITFRSLVLNNNICISPIIDLFPKKFKIEMLYKNLYWQCYPKLPYLDIDRITDATKDKKLNDQELIRSKILNDFII